MKTQATELQAAENDLKQLMADVTRVMEKAQEAVARIASKAATATTETESLKKVAGQTCFSRLTPVGWITAYKRRLSRMIVVFFY